VKFFTLQETSGTAILLWCHCSMQQQHTSNHQQMTLYVAVQDSEVVLMALKCVY